MKSLFVFVSLAFTSLCAQAVDVKVFTGSSYSNCSNPAVSINSSNTVRVYCQGVGWALKFDNASDAPRAQFIYEQLTSGSDKLRIEIAPDGYGNHYTIEKTED